MNDKQLGALYGALVGDACGCSYEFKPASALPRLDLIDMHPPAGFKKTYPKIPIGTYTDDGTQVLCLFETLLEGEGALVSRLTEKLTRWMTKGYMAVDGIVFDVGNQTSQALAYPHLRAELADESRYSGNGSLMRCIPSALVATHLEHAMELADRQSQATHPSATCRHICALYAGIAFHLLEGFTDVEQIVDWLLVRLMRDYLEDEEQLTFISAYRSRTPKGSGYVVDSFWSALHALRVSSSYEETIRQAIALGDDTDTTACIAGGLAGIKYGYRAIPKAWLRALRGKDTVQNLVGRFEECDIRQRIPGKIKS